MSIIALYTIAEVATRLDVEREEARRLVESRTLRSVVIKGATRVRSDDLQEFMEERESNDAFERVCRFFNVRTEGVIAIHVYPHGLAVDRYYGFTNLRDRH